MEDLEGYGEEEECEMQTNERENEIEEYDEEEACTNEGDEKKD